MLFIIPLNVSSISMQYIHLGRPFFQREDLPFFVYVLGKGKNEKNSAGFLLCNCHGSALTNFNVTIIWIRNVSRKNRYNRNEQRHRIEAGGHPSECGIHLHLFSIFFIYPSPKGGKKTRLLTNKVITL